MTTPSLPDARLRRRAELFGAALAAHPDRTLPRLLEPSALEASYRFLNNPRVNFESVLAPHVDETYAAARGCESVLAIHDTTSFVFGGEVSRGLGIDSGGRAFTSHVTLLASSDAEHDVLGVVAVENIFRIARVDSSRNYGNRAKSPDKESLRWIRGVDNVAARAPVPAIHVVDGEGDWYDLLAHLIENEQRFVIRLVHDRTVFDDNANPGRLREVLGSAPGRANREVRVASRSTKRKPPQTKHKHPERSARMAQLEFAGCAVELRRPTVSAAKRKTIVLNIVHVREVDPPKGVEPIEWMLATSEPIETVEQVLRIVDHYRARWLIEDFFKALKTGCAYEKRQFESRQALLNMLAMLLPVAALLLKVRAAARSPRREPASRLVNELQLLILRRLAERDGREFPRKPTSRDVALAVAELGGYKNKSRPPGFIVLGRGLQDLIVMEAGWLLAKQGM